MNKKEEKEYNNFINNMANYRLIREELERKTEEDIKKLTKEKTERKTEPDFTLAEVDP